MIEVQNLGADIGSLRVLNGIDLNLSSGQLLALVGANGAGKTTFLRALSGLIEGTSGAIRFAGEDISHQSAHIRSRLGLIHVPQGRQVIPHLTVEENLLIGSEQVGSYTNESRREALEAEYERFPVLKDRRKVLAGALSGGEQQMVAISRGLMMCPKVIMLDEPSLGLAPKIVEFILQTLRRLADSGVAVLLVEQAAIGALKIADRGAVLQGGRIVLEGSGSELLHNPELVKGFLG